MRYLFLIALLLDPTPPPLICIEEPEIGLHPDILPTIAEMLIEASQRTQLIVTTHSDALVSGLSEYPESVLVGERNNTGSHLRRLEPNRLKNWLEKYTLGDLAPEILKLLNVARVRQASPNCDRLFTTLAQIMEDTTRSS